MSKKIDFVKQNVKLLIESDPELRECYNLLITTYWERFELAETLQDARRCTPAETITRALRSLVRTGDVTLDSVTKAKRLDKRKEFHEYFSKEVQP